MPVMLRVRSNRERRFRGRQWTRRWPMERQIRLLHVRSAADGGAAVVDSRRTIATGLPLLPAQPVPCDDY